MYCGRCEREPKYKELYGCEGKQSRGMVDIAGRSYDTCPLYPLTQDREVAEVLNKYTLFKKSYPTYSEIQNINPFDMEIFMYIDDVVSDWQEREQKKLNRNVSKQWQ